MRVGVVVTGGSSTRMGTDKALVEVAGRRMIDHVIDAMLDLVDEVVISGPDHLGTGMLAIPDMPGAASGPLSGLAAAMDEVADTDEVLLVAVDQPLLRPATVVSLLELADGERAVIPFDQFRQVTCAVYPAGWRDEIRHEAVVVQGSLQTLLDHVPYLEVAPADWRAWGEDGRSWFSVDTPEAVDAAEDWVATGVPPQRVTG